MATSSGEGPSRSGSRNRNNTSRIRKRPRITIRYRSRESEERNNVEAQGGSTNHEDRERDAREGRERQNEEIQEEAEDAVAAEEEETEDVNEVVEVEESFFGEKIASEGDGGGGGRDGSIPVTLTDPDILNCCICRQPLTIPVFQCENGHIACSTCCAQLALKCYSCTAPIGNIRCRAIEKVLESLKISCCYARHGCIEKITHINKSIHEKDCIYTPCWCPIGGCQFTAPSKKLSQHINNEHHGSFINFYYNSFLYLTLGLNQKIVVLKEVTDSHIYIIKNDLAYLGNTIKVFHIGPKSSAETYRYDLYARSRGCCLKLDSFVNHTLGNNFPATTKFLLVPVDFLGPSPEVNIEIRVYKVYESSRRE